MTPSFMRRAIVPLSIFALVAGGVYFGFFSSREKQLPVPIVEAPAPVVNHSPIGLSVEGRSIEAYTYGTGPTHLLFAGGVHGGYEWNSVLLAYMLVDYLDEHPEFVPENMTVTVIPSVNPDGVYKVTGKEDRFDVADVSTDKILLASARFNANEVDLNRNFDCKWQPESTWQSRKVSAGASSFSEPESRAIRDFVVKNNPVAVVFWHSQANAVYASECEKGILPMTRDIMTVYAEASGYSPIDTFDSYAITGDAEGWLASIDVPAITVELKTHETVEWEKNLAGIRALFEYFK